MVFLRDLLAGGWLQNLLIGVVLLLITPLIGKLMDGRRGTIIGAATGITLLVWIFALIALRQPSTPLETQERPKTLRDYFLSDFPHTFKLQEAQLISSTKHGENVQLDTRLYWDFDAKAMFLSFYIPSTPSTIKVCEYIAREGYKHALNLMSQVDAESKIAGDRAVHTSELKFTGSVFVYHESPLFESDKDKIIPLFKTNGVSPQFRGSDYAYLRNNPP